MLFCAPLTTHLLLPACLLQGQEPPLGEEVQSVTNRAIFITAVSGLGEEGGEGEGAEAQSLQLALQTRTCSAESGSQSKLEREPRRREPPAPTCLSTSCLPPCLPDQVKGDSPLLLTSCSLLRLSGCIWGG